MLLVIFIKKKKAASLTSYQLFIKNVKGVSLNDTMYLVKLTESFKKYIEDVYSYSLRGKTSSEIIGEIKNIKEVNPILKIWKNGFMNVIYLNFQVKPLHMRTKKAIRKFD